MEINVIFIMNDHRIFSMQQILNAEFKIILSYQLENRTSSNRVI